MKTWLLYMVGEFCEIWVPDSGETIRVPTIFSYGKRPTFARRKRQ